MEVFFLRRGMLPKGPRLPRGYDENLGKVQEMTEQLMDGGERT